MLLALAEAGLYEPRWSERILLETEGALTAKLELPPAKAAKRIAAMRAAFPEASVHGFEPLEPALACHPKDRHVLAAAIAAGASTIVTGNLKDFPKHALKPHAVDAVHPDRFLCGLLAASPERCQGAIKAEAATRRSPPQTAAAPSKSRIWRSRRRSSRTRRGDPPQRPGAAGHHQVTSGSPSTSWSSNRNLTRSGTGPSTNTRYRVDV